MDNTIQMFPALLVQILLIPVRIISAIIMVIMAMVAAPFFLRDMARAIDAQQSIHDEEEDQQE